MYGIIFDAYMFLISDYFVSNSNVTCCVSNGTLNSVLVNNKVYVCYAAYRKALCHVECTKLMEMLKN